MEPNDATFPDFASAMAYSGEGYDSALISEVIAYKVKNYAPNGTIVPEQLVNSVIAVAIAASEFPDQPIKVLDFGGGCGFQYFQVDRALKLSLKWAIVESSVMSTRAAEVGKGKFTAHSNIESAVEALGGTPTLLHTSGTIQYLPDPLRTLQKLLDIHAPHFAMPRFPQWDGPTVVTIQQSLLSDNGLGPLPPNVEDQQIRYPATFIDFRTVLETIRCAGYEVFLQTRSQSADYNVAGVSVPGISVFCRLKHGVEF